jgi:putative tryptophan/tyrosine transport system substrate-binding protein
MKRREFILGGAACAWSVTTRAQQNERIRRIGVILPAASSDIEYQTWLGAFLQALAELGWTIGRNMRVDIRWATPNSAKIRHDAAELAALAPDVILTGGTSTAGPMLEATRTVPIVFATIVDPVGAGFIDSLARPGGNATGFLLYDYNLAGKWLGLLKQIAPTVKRVAVLRDAATPSGTGQFAAIQAVAPSLNLEVIPVNMREAAELERAIGAFARLPNGGLVLTGSNLSILHRDLIIALAARHKLPTIYYERFYVVSGGLISYGSDRIDLYRLAAGYVNRVLRGEKPGDLPVQAPTKFELAINLKTAKALGLTVPTLLLATATETIE